MNLALKESIRHELSHHAPFTIFGALTGILIMAGFPHLPRETSYKLFYTLHPLHVFFSSLTAASIYSLHECSGLPRKCGLRKLILVAFVGAVGLGTLSDSLIPYLGEVILGLPERQLHIGFIEEWWIVNPLAFLGILIAFYKPMSRMPHAAHVLISTWASLFHMMMAVGIELAWWTYPVIFLFLFAAVWLPCCVSDIVFPLLFVHKRS